VSLIDHHEAREDLYPCSKAVVKHTLTTAHLVSIGDLHLEVNSFLRDIDVVICNLVLILTLVPHEVLGGWSILGAVQVKECLADEPFLVVVYERELEVTCVLLSDVQVQQLIQHRWRNLAHLLWCFLLLRAWIVYLVNCQRQHGLVVDGQWRVETHLVLSHL